MKKGIIFDMDGTLWDSAESVAKSWRSIIEESGLRKKEITAADIKSVMGKTMDVAADILFGELPKKERMELLDECCRLENEYLREHGESCTTACERLLRACGSADTMYRSSATARPVISKRFLIITSCGMQLTISNAMVTICFRRETIFEL